MWELQERKAMALAKPLPDDWFRDDSGGLRKAEEEEGVEEQDPVAGFAPRKTPADDANDTKSLGEWWWCQCCGAEVRVGCAGTPADSCACHVCMCVCSIVYVRTYTVILKYTVMHTHAVMHTYTPHERYLVRAPS